MAYININNLKYSYKAEDGSVIKDALKGISLEIEKGEFIAIVGSNGSGKSTLAKHLNALLLPTEGDVVLDGMNTKDEASLWTLRSKCGMVFQNPDNQLVSSIVEDDVAFGPENLAIDPAEIRVRVDEALKAVDMYEHRKKGPHMLSGGQKQRIAIAGVLAMKPDTIVFDEPTAMLDPKGRKEIIEIIKKLHEEGKTIILVTHFMEEAILADKILAMKDGKVTAFGSPKEVFAKTDIKLPFAAELAKLLRDKGINVPQDIYLDSELKTYLCSLK